MSSAGVVAISPTRNEPALLPPCAHSQDSLSESIVIFVAMKDWMKPMRVLVSESIESVKLKIANSKGFGAKSQKLVCKGRELARSNSLLRDYGVTEGNVLHLVVRFYDLQLINVRTSCGKEFSLRVERGCHVGYIKSQIAKKVNDLVNHDDQVLCNGEKLEDQRLIDDICENNDAVIHIFVQRSAKIRTRGGEKSLELSISASSKSNVQADHEVERERRCGTNTESNPVVHREPPEREHWLKPLIVKPNIELPSVICDLVNSTFEGLDRGKYPLMSSEGTGGAYFMPDASGNKYISVFKPNDEEPMAPNNPRGLPLTTDGEGLKKGTRVGGGAVREVAAYILDHPKAGRRSITGEVREDKGFAGVPPTAMVECFHKGFNHGEKVSAKIGSLQMFMKNSGSCEDMGPSSFPVEEVHKISVLDIRMANADRHAGNILMSEGEDGRTVLIPIDHGYCLPDTFEDCTFDWLYWPQSRQPYSPDTVQYIQSMNADEDIKLLESYGWDVPLEFARTLRISTMLLQKGVEKGLTPFEIGSIMCRKTLNKESVIEEIVREAEECVLPKTSEQTFIEAVEVIMDHRLDEITNGNS